MTHANRAQHPADAFAPTRRSFIQGSLALAGAAGLAGIATALSGCANPAGGEKGDGAPGADATNGDGAASATKATAAPVAFTAGTYEGSAQGKHGPITVQVAFGPDSIEAITVESHTETADLSDVALTVIPQAILATQSLGVDTVSGATLTSMGVIGAVGEAAAQAGADAAALRNAPADYQPVQAMKPGTYKGASWGKWKEGSIEGERHGCPAVIEPLEVEVTVDETSIKSVKVLACSDTPGFMEPALEQMPQRIVDQQSLYADTVTGATLTAAGISAAVCRCLEQAGADLAGFAKATPKKTNTEQLSCDLVIVGAGLTGTAAALKATDLGINTIVAERTNRVSGTGACSSGPFAVGSKMDADAGITLTADEAFSIRMQEDQGRTNAPLVREVVHATGRMIDWMQERWEAIGDKGFSIKPSKDPMNLMHIYGKGTQKFQDLYDSYILPAGAQLLYSTSLEDIRTDDAGNVTTLVARRQDGTEVDIACKAVLLATGGFGGNAAMMKERLNGVFDNVGLSSNTGDAIVLCEKLGCAMSDDLSPALAEFCSNDVLDYYAGYMKFINQLGFLMLDPAGARFMNEELCLTESNSIGAAAMRRASWSWVILTQADLDSLQAEGVWGHLTREYCDEYEMRSRIIDPVYTTIKDEMDECIAYGQAFKADTLEALGKAVGFNEKSYAEAIDDYRKAVADGTDPLFGKDPRLLYPLDDGPFYAVRIISPIDNTYNGIRVDTSFRALDENLTPSISGLYLAGMDSGGYFTYPYSNFLGSSSSYCLTSGMLAAEAVAEFLEK
uniref:FAD-binding protein n=1 Tax=Muribaculaceae bacterium Z82 TaxID=2304548 RepID=A0A7C9JIH2_9BACT